MSRKVKTYCKNGKKYMLVREYGDIEWADKIKEFRVYDLQNIKRHIGQCFDPPCLLFTSIGGNVVRINRNGKKYYSDEK